MKAINVIKVYDKGYKLGYFNAVRKLKAYRKAVRNTLRPNYLHWGYSYFKMIEAEYIKILRRA